MPRPGIGGTENNAFRLIDTEAIKKEMVWGRLRPRPADARLKMAEPLTKRTKSGALYTRPPAIEAAIDKALALDRVTLERRAAVVDKNSPDYIAPECLVHLVRKRHREANAPGRDQLLNLLLQRCVSGLARALPDDRAPNAAYIRDEALGRFNSAFAALRTDLVRAEIRSARRFAHLPEGDDDEGRLISDDQGIARLPGAALRNPANQEDRVFLRQISKLINELPPDQREAVILVRIMGYEAESDDPTKVTAATRSGVSGRTIRKRLRRAAAVLKRYKEGL
jgi:DNA-directed RNA polymerase specialized sigma24 family protein